MKLIDKDALVAEIRKRLLPVIRDKHYDEWEEGQDSERIAILDIIDTLEVEDVQEEPVSEELEEAANDYAHDLVHDDVFENFIAGAKWQKKQTIEKICKWLEDNVDHYAYNKDFVPNAKECFIKMFRRAEI
jgi:hypothetical protein